MHVQKNLPSSTDPFERVTLPLTDFMSKVYTLPESPTKSNLFAVPVHFLSQVALDLGLNLVPAAINVKVHLQVFLPTFTCSFLNTSGP